MEHISLQLGCLIILLYITALYVDDSKTYKIEDSKLYFGQILGLGITNIVLDMAKSYAVNTPWVVPRSVTYALYEFYFLSVDTVVFMVCKVILHLTGTWPKSKKPGSGSIFLSS